MTPETPEPMLITAPAEAAGARLDKWLADAGTGMSRSRLRVLIEEGRVTANGQPATDASAKVIIGATYAIDLPIPVGALPEPEDIPLDIVFEDEHLIIIDKPAGLVVHPAGGSERGTLVNALLFHCGPKLGGKSGLTGIGGVARPGIVHRLDKDTSGVMVAAKSEAAHTALTNMFAAHDIERAYLAVTRGAPRPLIGRIETNIARSPNDRKKMAVV
ncbi:MAG: RluA family pseudouridine synthase, partial [Hyphomonadaceae bacterium]|nr:RluA family pseudouridine synthase [Hyphomonadaceae bacterium]